MVRPSESHTKTLAHISDLHLGRSVADHERAIDLCRAFEDSAVDHVVVTGDVTHRGRRSELQLFQEVFAPLLAAGRMTVVPGNHDRLGEDLNEAIMPGARVQVARAPGLHIVRVNSTGEHNRRWIAGHGILHDADLDALDAAIDAAPADHLVVVAVHHHVLPQRADHLVERWVSAVGLPYASELARGRELVERVHGRCGLVLHGHRHRSYGEHLPGETRPLGIYNAGSSTLLGGARLFRHVGDRVLGPPSWLQAAPLTAAARNWAPEAATAVSRLARRVRAAGVGAPSASASAG